ncbi:MAG TPA: hypothetical protein VH834_18135 [Solirubrobacteraceae bacterium]|jgi:hypothetical protein
MSDADVVLAALRSWGGPDGTVCAPVREIAVLTELSEPVVRSALADLCADGRLIFTGRRHRKTAVFRFASPSTPRSEQGGREATPRGSTSLTPADATSSGDAPAQPVVSEDDEEELSEEEWARRRAIGLKHAYAFLDRYDEEIGEPDQDGGECGECGREARRRWSLGMFVLCRDCRRRRARAGRKVGVGAGGGVVVPLPLLGGEELDEELETLVREHGGANGNGNGGSSVWDEPDF